MAYNPLEASLYVTFSGLTHNQSVMTRISQNPDLPSRTIEYAYDHDENYIKEEITSFTTAPSALEPYTSIIYRFTKRLSEHYLTTPSRATDMVTDVLTMQPSSDTMVVLMKEQIRYLTHIKQLLEYCENRNIADGPRQLQEWKKKAAVIQAVFNDSKPSITGNEYSQIMNLAETADATKAQFQLVNCVYRPK